MCRGLPVFRPFEQVCTEPLAGEPAGASDGDVCTWEAISACTEPGREYTDYASCDPVFTQRPYGPYEVAVPSTEDDPRIDDAAYMAELAWVTDEVKACACTCCHSSETAPDGPAGWYIEAGPLWIDTLDDDGLAMLAGWVDSTAFGAFEASGEQRLRPEHDGPADQRRPPHGGVPGGRAGAARLRAVRLR
jgi:hypothetical protein